MTISCGFSLGTSSELCDLQLGHTSRLFIQFELLCTTSEMLLPQMNVSQV